MEKCPVRIIWLSASLLFGVVLGSAAPSPRGRKGRSKQDETSINYDTIAEQWINDVDVNALLHEDGFKKHLQNHCNK